METIFINKHYDRSFLIQEGSEIHSITIPNDADIFNYNSILLSHSPNVEEFIVENNDSFEFSDGVLYSKNRDYRNIVFITKAVRNLKIAADVRSISYWHGVDDVIVDNENTAFTVSGNMLLSQSGRELYFVFDNAEEAIIPEGVDKIHYRAFEYCKNLKKIEIPESYSWDEWYTPSFEPLWSLNDNVEKPEIVVRGNKVSVVDGIVLKYDTPKYYFGDLKCCRIPNNVRRHFNFDTVFKSVENFSVRDDHPSFCAVNGVLLDKKKKKLMFYPKPRKEFAVPESVSTICSFAVAYCNNLEEIVIPENITLIESNAFANCVKLDSVIISGNNTEIDPNAFDGCVFTKGDYLIGMEKGVFYRGRTVTDIDCRYEGGLKVREGTQSIKQIVGPGRPGVVEFGATEVNSETLALPASVKEIGPLLIPMKNIIVDDSNATFCSVDGILFSKDMKTLIRYPERHNGDKYTVPESVETIAKYAFYNCQNLKSVTIRGNIKHIGDNAFCYTNLDTIEMPAHPIKIEELAFLSNVYSKWSGLKQSFANIIINFRHGDLLIPLQLIDNWGVNKDELLLSDFVATEDVGKKQLIYHDVKKSEYKVFMAFYLAIVHDDEECIQYIKRSKTRWSGDKINLYANLIDHVLEKEKGLDKPKTKAKKKDPLLSKWDFLELPDGTYEIAKYKGKDLVIDVPDMYNGKPIKSIGESAFSGDARPTGKRIEKVRIPEGVEIINKHAFCWCSSLTEVSLPESLKKIGSYAFSWCKQLEELVLPAQVTSIVAGTFNHCIELKRLSIGNGVTFIEPTAFGFCDKLEIVEVRDSDEIRTITKEQINKREWKQKPKAIVSADDSPKTSKETKPTVAIDYELTRLKGKTFSAAGFPEKKESEIAGSVESNGGRYLYNFTSDLDYLIYTPNCDKEPIKVKKARILQKKGREITFITIEDYYKMIAD